MIFNNFFSKKKNPGHNLMEETMNISVPAFSVQLYNNPTLYWVSRPALLILITLANRNETVSIQTLKDSNNSLRNIFAYEFVFFTDFADSVSWTSDLSKHQFLKLVFYRTLLWLWSNYSNWKSSKSVRIIRSL